MTPGRHAPGVFCLQSLRQSIVLLGGRQDWRGIASHVDCSFWSGWHTRALRTAGGRANPRGEHFSLWHVAHQLDGMLSTGPDRPIHAKSHGYLAGLACGYRCRFLWRLHHVLQLRLGNREDAGRWRVGARYRLRRGERLSRLGAERRWHPAGQPLVKEPTVWSRRRVASPHPPAICMNIKGKDL